jgi:hypothetical protein
MKDDDERKPNASSVKYERQASVSATSRKGDEELLDSLKVIGEGNFLQVYQSEIKRFETVNNYAAGQLNASGNKPQDGESANQGSSSTSAPLIRKPSGRTARRGTCRRSRRAAWSTRPTSSSRSASYVDCSPSSACTW